jgi:diguanylate cyclase (GGDEF)-like protein
MPVWGYLVILALIPMIVVAVAGSLLVGERVNEARASRIAERTMTEVADLDNLRNALASELSSTAFEDAAVAFKMTRDELDLAFGAKLAPPLDLSRSATDTALAIVARSIPEQGGISELNANLGDARQLLDQSLYSPAAALAASYQTAVDFTKVLESAGVLEESIATRLAQGESGSFPRTVVFAAEQLRAVSELNIAGAREGDLLYLIIIAPSHRLHADVQQLDTVRGAYESAAARLAPELSPALQASYAPIASGEQKVLQAIVARWIAKGRPAISSLTTQVASDTVALGKFSKAIRSLLHSAVQEGTAAAARARAHAQERAWTTALVTALLLLVTALVLASVSVLLHRRLAGLAEQALQLRAGELTPVKVRGPREIATVAMALNAAGAVLRQLLRKSEKLAAGELDASELDEVTEGPLGTVVDTSIQSVRRAMREREAFQRQLSYLASHDSLTGVPNRSEAEALVVGALADAQRDGTQLAVLFVDLDNFKECNDTLGHRAGDHVLQVAATRMCSVVRPADTVCRLGGDEFVILLAPVESEAHAVAVGERVVAALSEPDEFDGADLRITASVGIAITGAGVATTHERLLHWADLAVYEAKDAGGDTWRLHRAETPTEVLAASGRLTIDVAPG